jgi:predicted HD phosphohydrolase
MSDEGQPGPVERPRTGFRAMTEASAEDWATIAATDRIFERGLPGWLLGALQLLQNDCHGFAIDRLQHCLQAATRAYRAGCDEEYIACALVHDVGATLAPQTHDAFVAMIMRPYVSEANHWMLAHHGVFQKYYFGHFFGGDRNEREQHRGHPYFERTAEFCHQFDQMSFDPDYDTLALRDFAPLLHRVLAQPRR